VPFVIELVTQRKETPLVVTREIGLPVKILLLRLVEDMYPFLIHDIDRL